MRRTFAFGTALLFALTSAACAGGEDTGDTGAMEDTAADTGAMASGGEMGTDTGGGAMAQTPSWFRVNGNQVEMDIVAGATDAGTSPYWNFNGAFNGQMTITVPEGAQVTINFKNNDPNLAHSIGVSDITASPPPTPMPPPVFEGAISSNPTDMAGATATGATETLTFTASTAGEYSLLCYIAGHAITGMWVKFNVGGEAGVTGAPDVEISMD